MELEVWSILGCIVPHNPNQGHMAEVERIWNSFFFSCCFISRHIGCYCLEYVMVPSNPRCSANLFDYGTRGFSALVSLFCNLPLSYICQVHAGVWFLHWLASKQIGIWTVSIMESSMLVCSLFPWEFSNHVKLVFDFC